MAERYKIEIVALSFDSKDAAQKVMDILSDAFMAAGDITENQALLGEIALMAEDDGGATSG